MLDDLFTVDAHEDIAYHLTHFKRDFVKPEMPCQISLPWLREGGVRLVFNTIFIHPRHKPEGSRTNALLQLDTYDELIRAHGEELMRVSTGDDLRTLQGNHKIGFLTLMEGADPLEAPGDIHEFFDRGVRVLGPAWNNRNLFASGPETDQGLTPMGTELIGVMNALGVTLDLSHLNQKCFWEAIEMTGLAPLATHSNCRALRDHPRNLHDDQLRAIAEAGGVVGLVLYGPFLKTGTANATLTDLLAHAEHMIEVMGEDHVGIGTDLDGAELSAFPPEIATVADVPKISSLFLERGFGDELVRKIMGGNFLRVMSGNLPHGAS